MAEKQQKKEMKPSKSKSEKKRTESGSDLETDEGALLQQRPQDFPEELGAVGGVEEGAVGGVEEGAVGGVEEGAVGGVEEGAVGGVGVSSLAVPSSSSGKLSPIKTIENIATNVTNWFVKKISPKKGTKDESSSQTDKPEDSEEAVRSKWGFGKRKAKSPKEKKMSKYESAKLHGGFPKTGFESYYEDEESSGVYTETTSVKEESSIAMSPLEKDFPEIPELEEDSDEDKDKRPKKK